MCHPDGFAGVEPSLHLWDKSHLVMMYGSYNVHWIQLTNASLRIFASMFISDIGLWFYFFVMYLSGFGIRVMLVS